MIRLAANYSRPLLDLIARHPGIVDAVKVSEFNQDRYISDYRQLVDHNIPLIVHGLGQNPAPGTPPFRDRFDPDKVRLAIEVCRPTYLSVHLEWCSSERFPGARQHLVRLGQDVALIRDLSGLTVHLENLFSYSAPDPEPDRANFNPPEIGSPEFIAEAVKACGAGFLLDIGHAQVAAWHRGEETAAYIRRLPLELVREIHISAPALKAGILRDRHHEIGPDSLALLSAALDACTPETVSLEYGGVGPAFAGKSDPEALLRQLGALRDAITKEH